MGARVVKVYGPHVEELAWNLDFGENINIKNMFSVNFMGKCESIGEVFEWKLFCF